MMSKPAMRSIGIVVVAILSFSLSWIPAHRAQAESPTDEQLQELERQIELEEKTQAQKRAKEKSKRQAEEQTFQQAEKETMMQAEALKKERYLLLISEGQQAILNNDKNLALTRYNEALVLYPEDTVAYAGFLEAVKLADKFCDEILGTWEGVGITLTFKPGGTWSGLALFVPINGAWNCMDPNVRTFYVQGTVLKSWMAVLREDGCLTNAIGGCFRKAGEKRESPETSMPAKNPLLNQ